MPTLEEWEQALSRPRLVRVNHRWAFFRKCGNATRRKMQSANKAKKRYHLPQRQHFSRSGFQSDSGCAGHSSPPAPSFGSSDKPQIENLADICSTWQYFRYLWAFDIPSTGEASPALRLSDAARNHAILIPSKGPKQRGTHRLINFAVALSRYRLCPSQMGICRFRFPGPVAKDSAQTGSERRSETTIDNYLTLFKAHITPRWGATFHTNLKAVEVEVWHDLWPIWRLQVGPSSRAECTRCSSTRSDMSSVIGTRSNRCAKVRNQR